MQSPQLANTPRCFALIPCAGIGTRAGTSEPKQYVHLAGQAMVAHTLAALLKVARLQALLVVVAAEDRDFERHLNAVTSPRIRLARCGGATRAETVTNGLVALLEQGAADDDWVLVHDAARCLIRAEQVDDLIDACWNDSVGGLLALPLADTLKEEREGRVHATLARSGKWLAQTPQMFRIGMLRNALMAAGPAVTDESSALEAIGHSPLLVRGSAENLKLTYPADFDLAERLLKSRT
ncbi:MAG: 2-C-methyl-D-erythritol 4-phosphate cytidylyltransferase [Ideonella sp.]